MDQTNQPKPASKKGIYIIIGIVVLLVIVYIAKGSMSRTYNINGVNVDQRSDGTATYSSKEGTVTVGNAKLPDGWPSDVSQYPKSTVQYSASSNPQTGEKGLSAVFLSSDSTDKVSDFYKSDLVSKGWKIEQTASMGTGMVLTAKKDTRNVGLYIIDNGEGQVSVTISITSSATE